MITCALCLSTMFNVPISPSVENLTRSFVITEITTAIKVRYMFMENIETTLQLYRTVNFIYLCHQCYWDLCISWNIQQRAFSQLSGTQELVCVYAYWRYPSASASSQSLQSWLVLHHQFIQSIRLCMFLTSLQHETLFTFTLYRFQDMDWIILYNLIVVYGKWNL